MAFPSFMYTKQELEKINIECRLHVFFNFWLNEAKDVVTSSVENSEKQKISCVKTIAGLFKK